MKKNKMKFLGIFLIVVLLFTMFAFPVSASILGDVFNTGAGSSSLVEGLLGAGAGLLEGIVGLNPVVHGLIAGVYSGIKTFSTLSKIEIDFILDRDKVNLSQEEKDYFTPLDNFLFDNMITQDLRQQDNMLLTDKNVLDTRFINVTDLSQIDSGQTSPNFRLSEKTKLVKVLDSNNQAIDVQKREILFEDTDKTIEYDYEYRNFVIKYPKTTFKGGDHITYDLEFSDLFDSWGMLLLSYFSTNAGNINISSIRDGSNGQLFARINENKTTDVVTENFKLIFNSFVRDELDSIVLDQVNCIAENGNLLGNTGTDALPRIALDWTFDSQEAKTISGMDVSRENWCDALQTGEDDKHSIYCDATQFTIEILNKINLINQFVEDNRNSFTCPTPGVTQTLLIQNNNLGITSLKSNYYDRFVEFEYTVEGSFNLPDEEVSLADYGTIEITVKVDNSEVETKSYPLKISDFIDNKYTGTDEYNVGFLTSDDTKIEVIAILNLHKPYDSLDIQGDNLLSNNFTPFSEVCNLPKTSQNIVNFASQNFDNSLVDFRAYLMMDGYSNDFKQDFDRYYRFNVTGAPTFYTDEFYKYLISDKFNFISSFESQGGNLVLPGAGRYYVKLNIEFDDQWELFDPQGNITGNIEVVLSRDQPPATRDDSPLYYMPLNGLVGFDTDNARQGYGVDFVGDVIAISQLNETEYLRTEPFTQSNTINTVRVTEYGKVPNDFSFLNNGNTRGMLLNISLSPNKTNPELYFIPSRATPVGLKITNHANHAYAFYKLDVGAPADQGGSPAQTPGTLLPWTGVGNCLDFTGLPILESYLGRPDIAALSSQLAPTTASQSIAYGVEWNQRNITRQGNIFLRSVVYTPSNFQTGNGLSVLHLDSFDDSAKLYTIDSPGGSNSVELRNYLSKDIKYLKDIFDLVKEKNACISNSPNNLSVYYNPANIADVFFGEENTTDSQNNWVNQRGECIVN